MHSHLIFSHSFVLVLYIPFFSPLFLQDLPSPTPVECRIPDASFGDFMMVLEFINIFYELLELRDVYPQGITFEMLEHALVNTEVAGE